MNLSEFKIGRETPNYFQYFCLNFNNNNFLFFDNHVNEDFFDVSPYFHCCARVRLVSIIFTAILNNEDDSEYLL